MFHSYCFDMYIDVRLSHLNEYYLLTYLLACCMCVVCTDEVNESGACEPDADEC